MFTVDDLQAVEVEELTGEGKTSIGDAGHFDDGVVVVIHEERDDMGFARVSVTAPTRDAVLAFVRDQWGDDEATGGWYSEHVVARIEEVEIPVAAESDTRTILVHLNIEVPAASAVTVDDIVREIEGALEVGSDTDATPSLIGAEVVVALAEEI